MRLDMRTAAWHADWPRACVQVVKIPQRDHNICSLQTLVNTMKQVRPATIPGPAFGEASRLLARGCTAQPSRRRHAAALALAGDRVPEPR